MKYTRVLEEVDVLEKKILIFVNIESKSSLIKFNKILNAAFF